MILLREHLEVPFDPSKPDIDCPEKDVMTQAVVRMLKKITNLSNSNLIKNADVIT